MPAFQGACLAIAHCREFCGRRRLGATGRVHVAVGPNFAIRGRALFCNSWPCLILQFVAEPFYNDRTQIGCVSTCGVLTLANSAACFDRNRF